MNVIPTELSEVLILEPKVHGDERGFFMESWNQRTFDEVAKTASGDGYTFVQDNHSRSTRGVLRGLHFQRPPHAQGKLVRVGTGSVFDVAVDLRQTSETFGRWVGVELSAANRRQLWIPPGFAHGFLTTSESADFIYKTTDYYNPACESAVNCNDPSIGIKWPMHFDVCILSEKDRSARSLAWFIDSGLLFD